MNLLHTKDVQLTMNHEHKLETRTHPPDGILEGKARGPKRIIQANQAYSFPVTPCTIVELNLWDQMIARVLVKKHKVPKFFLRAMVKEDLHNFGIGSPSVKYDLTILGHYTTPSVAVNNIAGIQML